jgi:hypothetical protein
MARAGPSSKPNSRTGIPALLLVRREVVATFKLPGFDVLRFARSHAQCETQRFHMQMPAPRPRTHTFITPLPHAKPKVCQNELIRAFLRTCDVSPTLILLFRMGWAKTHTQVAGTYEDVPRSEPTSPHHTAISAISLLLARKYNPTREREPQHKKHTISSDPPIVHTHTHARSPCPPQSIAI